MAAIFGKAKLDNNLLWKLYNNDKMSDRQMAEEVNVSRYAIADWRHRNGLPPHKEQRVYKKKVAEMSPLAQDNADARKHKMTYGAWKALQFENAGRPRRIRSV